MPVYNIQWRRVDGTSFPFAFFFILAHRASHYIFKKYAKKENRRRQIFIPRCLGCIYVKTGLVFHIIVNISRIGSEIIKITNKYYNYELFCLTFAAL